MSKIPDDDYFDKEPVAQWDYEKYQKYRVKNGEYRVEQIRSTFKSSLCKLKKQHHPGSAVFKKAYFLLVTFKEVSVYLPLRFILW
jgi:hypothetical protein